MTKIFRPRVFRPRVFRLQPPLTGPEPPGRPPASRSVETVVPQGSKNRQTILNTHKSGTAEHRRP
jgi:hypothetical protein